jgi:hypothetical protein
MKNQNEFLPKSLAALPQLDSFIPGTNPADGEGGNVGISPFETIDVQLISSHPANPGGINPYTEVHLNGPADGGTVPITANEDSDRVMMLMSLPKPNAEWRMSLVVNKGASQDTIDMQGIEGKYDSLKATLANSRNLRHEEAGLYFTIEAGPRRFETYVNINQPTEVVKLSYTNLDTFDQHCVSLIAKAKV